MLNILPGYYIVFLALGTGSGSRGLFLFLYAKFQLRSTTASQKDPTKEAKSIKI